MNNVDLTGAQWRKSSHSGGQGGECVEVAATAVAAVAVRDSKDPHGPKLVLDAAAWRALTRSLKG
ncbi:DUF397 domain-containing protein [Actinomadura opuntiae]|uniref:DUF397 domain-containing protein n=1 Tax=Actinomadura sp. OS1-43 TaxID=604315 RepID=UPI00255B0EB7|nr:DUF397 domain-containing protein [Actinomadura sp. OS1-43]MDL4815357.1 DUF397 domain-containing protein [Actinomadura sp. OS1-43]